jgi:hypothetical protein
MIKLINILISLIQVYTYNLIDTTIRITERPFYISKKIEDKTDIYNAVDEYNRFSYFYPALLETNNKKLNHIRIQYGDLMGATAIKASLYSDDKFYIDDTVISFNKRATGNTLQCIILHEILHTQLITHNNIAGSIMNYSVSITHDGDIIQEASPCKLNVDDIVNLIYVKNNL